MYKDFHCGHAQKFNLCVFLVRKVFVLSNSDRQRVIDRESANEALVSMTKLLVNERRIELNVATGPTLDFETCGIKEGNQRAGELLNRGTNLDKEETQ